MTRFWQDAASVFETASAVADGTAANLAILVDEGNGLRIVDSSGWTVDSLRREYNVTTAYTVTRSGSGVVVEGNNGSESCRFKKNVSNASLTNLGGGIAHHLVRPVTPYLT